MLTTHNPIVEIVRATVPARLENRKNHMPFGMRAIRLRVKSTAPITAVKHR